MDYQTLLHDIEARITPKMREDFQKEFFEDEFNKHLNPQSYKVKYYEILNDYKGFYEDKTDLNFLQELMDLKILQDFKLEDAHLYVKEINKSIHDFYRFKQLEYNRPSPIYNSKLKFISGQYSNYFNVFRTYSLPSSLFDNKHQYLNNLSVFPSNKVEVDEYISFLEKYLTPSGDYRDFYGSNQKNTEYFIQVFVNRLTPDNCHSFISDYLGRLEQIYSVGRFQEVYSISVDFYRDIKKFNLNINEFLYQTSDPFIYFLTLFFRRLSQPVGEFKYYLETFDWEKEEDKVLYLTTNEIEISPRVGYESIHFEPNEIGKYRICYANFEQQKTFENLFKDKILKDDYNLIKAFFKELYAEIFNISHNVEWFVTSRIDNLNTILPSLENNKIRALFLNSIIPFISKSDKLQIKPLVWTTFSQKISSFKDEYLKALKPEIVHTESNSSAISLDNIDSLNNFSDSVSNIKNKIVFSNAHPDPKINEAKLNDIAFILKTNEIYKYLEKYFSYTGTGDLTKDLIFIYSLGYDDTKCNAARYFCAECIYGFLRYKTQCDLIKANHPFKTYQDKIDFLFKYDDIFEALKIQTSFDDIFFTTIPQDENEFDIYISTGWKVTEEANKTEKLIGNKLLGNLPNVTFEELKCKFYIRAKDSFDPKAYLQNEMNNLLSLFPKDRKYGIESIFWFIHDLKVNSEKFSFDMDKNYLSTNYIHHGPLAEHYVNYYFYLKDIIENSQDAFIESTKYIDSGFLYFHVTSHPALSQSEIEEITYSGKYIIEISRQEPIPYIYNIINSNKVLHKNFKAIIDFFMNTKLWEFPIIKPEFEINSDGRRIRRRSDDTFNPHDHANTVISIADNLPNIKESLLTEYINLISDVNKNTPLISNLKFIIKMNISNKPFMAKEEKKKKDRNPFQKFVYAIDIFGNNRKTVTISTIYPIYHYHEVEPIFSAAKKYTSAKFNKKKTNLERVLFLDDLLINISDITSTNNNDMINVLNYLKPFNFTFEELMQCTDKKISLYYELTMNDKVIPIIYPLDNEQDRVIEQRLTFIRFVIYHFKTKMIEYITGLKEKVEKEINLKQPENSTVSPSNTVKESNKINYESYEFFKKWFHYPLEYSPLGYYHQWQDNLNHLKAEIQDNLLNLDTPKSNIYLSKLNRELLDIQKTSNTTIEELNVWYEKYNTTEEDLIENYDYKNTLHKILNSEPINDREANDDDQHPDTVKIQRTFYDYHYGQVLEKSLSFIDDLKLNFEILSSNKNIDKNEKITPKSEFKKQTKNAGFVLLKHKIKSDKFKHFYYGLFDNGFIGDNLATFRQAFNGTSDSNKIVWLKGQNELNYLIYNLIDKEIIHNYGAWLHTHKMFILENGKPLGTHLKTNYYKGEHTILKNIINSFI